VSPSLPEVLPTPGPGPGASAAWPSDHPMAGIIDAALEAIIGVDRQQRIVLFNRAAVRMFGRPAKDAIGTPVDGLIPARLRPAHRAHVNLFAAEGMTMRRMGRTREVTGLRASGEEFPLEASIIRVGDGDRVLMVVTIRDATRLRQAEAAQLARLAAETANRAKTELLACVSHDLRTPLNAVLGFAELMHADTLDPLSARQRDRIERVLQAGAELRALVNGVLEALRVEAGRLAPQPHGQQMPAGAAPAPAAQPQRSPAPPSGLVLYIEDNPVNVMLVEQLLARWPQVRLAVAEDGTRGLAQAQLLQPDVVLLDMQLPDMDGVQVLQRLKADAATRDLNVVVLSADAVPQDMQAALDAGALDYWTKPVDFECFIAGMSRLLPAAVS
jgi:PAS domain S-box-containing protein